LDVTRGAPVATYLALAIGFASQNFVSAAVHDVLMPGVPNGYDDVVDGGREPGVANERAERRGPAGVPSRS
jgi:hypothetical protein